MSDLSYQPARIRNIILGILLFMVLLCALCNLSSTMKQVGNAFLFIPSQLGLLQRVKPAEVHTIDLRKPSPKLLELTRPGRYAVFTDDYDILMSNVLNGPVWLQVKSHTTGEKVNVVSVNRGARPYDTALAAGRPIFAFDVTVPGVYEVAYYFRFASISIVPDYTTGKETVIVLAYIIQIAVILTLLAIFYSQLNQRRRATVKAMEFALLQRRAKEQAFWEEENQSGTTETRNKQ
jgi:hypothetical protein